jgi:hypothetical protein
VNIWKIVSATLVIFIAGIVTGVVLVRLGERGSRPWARPNREAITRPAAGPAHTNLPPQQFANRPNNPGAGNNPAPLNREFVPLLERELRLTPEQREQIQKVVKLSQERIREARLRIEPEVRAEMQKAQEAIRSLLTPAQQEQYQQLMKRQLQRRNESGAPSERRFRDFRNSRTGSPPGESPDGAPENPPPPPP